MWLLLACTAAPDSSETVEDSTDSSSVVENLEYPWSEEGFWTEPGPLAPMLDTSHRPAGPFWAVWMATSTDGKSWVSREFPISFGLSSLNLLVTEAGVLITGVVDLRVFFRMGLELPPNNAIYALVSADLETWGSHSWEVNDPASRLVIDPGLWLDQKNDLHAAWFGTTYDGDPAQAPGAHSVRGAAWDGHAFAVQETDLFAAERLADPTICRMGDEDRLFYTEDAQRVRSAVSQDGVIFEADPAFQWEGVTVPWCREEEEHLVLLGQTVGGSGNPAQRQLNLDGSTVELDPPYGTMPFEAHDCTSLAVARYQGTWILVCASSYTE